MQPRRALPARPCPSSAIPLPAGMNMSPVSRLKKTWAKVKTAKFFILEVSKAARLLGAASIPRTQLPKCLPVSFQHQMDPTGNFCNYRAALRGAAHRSLTAHSSQEKVGRRLPSPSEQLLLQAPWAQEGCVRDPRWGWKATWSNPCLLPPL